MLIFSVVKPTAGLLKINVRHKDGWELPRKSFNIWAEMRGLACLRYALPIIMIDLSSPTYQKQIGKDLNHIQMKNSVYKRTGLSGKTERSVSYTDDILNITYLFNPAVQWDLKEQ